MAYKKICKVYGMVHTGTSKANKKAKKKIAKAPARKTAPKRRARKADTTIPSRASLGMKKATKSDHEHYEKLYTLSHEKPDPYRENPSERAKDAAWMRRHEGRRKK